MPAKEIHTEDLEGALRAARALGPASEAALGRPRLRRSLALRLERGEDPRDALVAVLGRCARRSRAVANELLRDVMAELMAYGSRVLPPSMRRLHDADDMVVSVLGDCFGELFGRRLRGRSELLKLLQQRIKWKTLDRNRGMSTLKRAEDPRGHDPAQGVASMVGGPSPPAQAAAREELQRLAQRVLALPARDRKILEMHIDGFSTAEIAAAVKLSPDTARRALRRLLPTRAAEDG